MNAVDAACRRSRRSRRGRPEQGGRCARRGCSGSRSATLAGILGISEATASRLCAGKYVLSPRARQGVGARAPASCACSGRSTRCGGTSDAARAWLASENLALGARPRDLLRVGRGTGPCRHVPGRRARSPLKRASARFDAVARRRGAARRRRRWRSSTRSTSSRCWSAFSTTRKPPVPAGARTLHYLLFTPFRYPPPPGGSRFRGPNDPGVFYGADEVRTACAELGYWRWRHLLRLAGARRRCRRSRRRCSARKLATRRRRPARSRRSTPRPRGMDRSRRLRGVPGASRSGARGAASARSATNRCAIPSARRLLARCSTPRRSRARARSSSRRGCCR